MARRYLSIWFRYLKTNWFSIRKPELRQVPFVLVWPDHGRMVIKAANPVAEKHHVYLNMAAADARAIVPGLQVIDDRPELGLKLLHGIAAWCLGYSPDVAIDEPDGLLLDITGCPHLWGSEKNYCKSLITRLKQLGYYVRVAIADTIGAAWAMARFGKEQLIIIEPGQQVYALKNLPPASLRLKPAIADRLHKLGLNQVGQFMRMPRATLQRRFGSGFIQRLHQALGYAEEIIDPIRPSAMYQERLPCLSPIVTATGIQIALQQLLEKLCGRLMKEQKGLRQACLKGYRVDGKIQSIAIGTHQPSHNASHLFKLFEQKIESIEPAFGIELFLLEAQQVEEITPIQENLWKINAGLGDTQISELLDRLSGKFGASHIYRFMPAEHYLPEHSVRKANSFTESLTGSWQLKKLRPLHLLSMPEQIEVMAPIPDSPPKFFKYKGKIHEIAIADGPERIEQEWWLKRGRHRDYYIVEDKEGQRYSVFRSGHYGQTGLKWFLHGFFP